MSLPASVGFRLARATVIFWVGVRVFALVVGMWDLAPLAHVAVIGFVLVLAHLDVRATNERFLYGNLAIGPRTVLGVVFAVAVVLEAAFTFALHAGYLPSTMESPF